VGLILDLAVAALALVVVGSLALLAWTLGVSTVRATIAGRARVNSARARVGRIQARVQSWTDATSASTVDRPGDSPDA
jgi:hypothetical protein